MSVSAKDQVKATVLVVDDDAGVIVNIGHALQDLAHTVFATNGTDALLLVKETPPDLILLDLELPGMSGLSLCRSLVANPKTAEIPVIFIICQYRNGS